MTQIEIQCTLSNVKNKEGFVQIFNQLDDIKKMRLSSCRVTIGRFQGVHVGHRHLIAHLEGGLTTEPKVIVTFDPPPEDILFKRIHQKIATTEDKIKIFKDLGIDIVFVIPFDMELAQLSATEFAQRYIFDLFKPVKIAVGYDFAFGKKREGNVDTLKKLASTTTEIVQVKPFLYNEEIVSTSLVRKKIQDGHVEFAEKLLLRPYSLIGTVVQGAQRGRTLGFPTANLQYDVNFVLPKEGVYAVEVALEKEQLFGVCNVGFNPTFTVDGRVKVECYILDFDRDIYGKSIKIHFKFRLRKEMKFQNRESLVAAIKNDIANTRKIFFPPA